MYAEQPSRLPHVTAWRSVTPTVAEVGLAPPGSRMFALRFAAGTGSAVLGVPADELSDLQVPLAELWPVADVRRLAEAADPMAALQDAAVHRWHDPDPSMVALAAGARAGRPVGAIADALGLSPRHLQRRSRTAFGYGPKTLARVLRLQRAVALARSGSAFAEVSAASGYADQAHLSREVKALAGVPLGELITAAAPSRRTDPRRFHPDP